MVAADEYEFAAIDRNSRLRCWTNWLMFFNTDPRSPAKPVVRRLWELRITRRTDHVLVGVFWGDDHLRALLENDLETLDVAAFESRWRQERIDERRRWPSPF
jgi:hypothetical protein